jgi:hypothetical protein
MSEQTITAGDWVRAETGEVGKVVHIARLTVFVQLEEEPANSTLKAFLESQLTKIEPPNPQTPAESHQQS